MGTAPMTSRLTALRKALEERSRRGMGVAEVALLDFAVAALEALKSPPFPRSLNCPLCRDEMQPEQTHKGGEVCSRHAALAQAETVAEAILGKEETAVLPLEPTPQWQADQDSANFAQDCIEGRKP